MFCPQYKLAEILAWVQTREREVSPVPLRSPQLRRRRQLVEWTAERAVEMELSTLTVHMAVRYSLIAKERSVTCCQVHGSVHVWS